jgi:hypothetical protein
MSSKYYPLVSDVLREQFPERYHRITYRQAWRQLWKGELFIVEGKGAERPNLVDGSEAGLQGPHGEFGEARSDPHIVAAANQASSG